jgi:hypothetical protein
MTSVVEKGWEGATMSDEQKAFQRKSTRTLGKGIEFVYTGSVDTGVVIHYGHADVPVKAELFRAILNEFRGREIPGGFSMTNPTPGGLGEWVSAHSHLTPRHASHIAAILVHEELARSTKRGRAVFVQF